MPGIFCIVDVIVLFMRPAIANVWPFCSSSSVSVRRVVSAGMRKPCSTTALAKSSVLTSGRTLRWTRSPLTVGVKFRRMPNSLNMTLMAMLAPEPCAIGNRETRRRRGSWLPCRSRPRGSARPGSGRALGLQRLDHGAEVVLLVEEEEVQEVAERELALGARDRCAEVAARFRPFQTVEAGAGNCCVVMRPIVFLTPVGLVKSDAPSSVIALRLTSAKRTRSSTWLLGAPACSCSRVTTSSRLST